MTNTIGSVNNFSACSRKDIIQNVDMQNVELNFWYNICYSFKRHLIDGGEFHVLGGAHLKSNDLNF